MEKTKTKKKVKPAEEAPKPRKVFRLREALSLKDTAEKIGLKPRDLIEKIEARGLRAGNNDPLDEGLAKTIGEIVDADIEILSYEKDVIVRAKQNAQELVTRPPVVTIMGHVDHGKTTLLDAIRSSHLVDKESGGITQHIGAYRVTFNNRSITFVDTPGHEAFTQLRARGAQVTDIVILVISADDGVMPQTKEAIHHAKAAGVPIIVAINKIDKPEANVDRVKQQLSKEGILVEDWGGDVISVEVSAKEKKNINDLLEMIILLSDVIEIKTNRKVEAQGIVLEARLDSQKGPVATIIIQYGVLSMGEIFITGHISGKVRAMFDEKGKSLKKAEPSMPVEVLGFSEVPDAGEIFQVVPDIQTAKEIVSFRLSKIKKNAPARPEHVTLDDLFKKIEEGKVKELAFILKADVQGSVEVLVDLIPSLGTEEVKVKILHAGTGQITESDVLLASASNAIILGYNIRPNARIIQMAKEENVEIRTYSIIYQLTDEIKKAIVGLLAPKTREVYLGKAEVRKIFLIPKVGVIAGCLVTDGKIMRNADIRVVRGKEVIHHGRIASLKRVKEPVNEVGKNMECGISLEGFKDIQEGDLITAYHIEKIKPE